MSLAEKVIRNNMLEWLEDTNQLNFATRLDAVSYCVGYYGECNALAWKVICQLAREGVLRI